MGERDLIPTQAEWTEMRIGFAYVYQGIALLVLYHHIAHLQSRRKAVLYGAHLCPRT